MRRVNVVGPSGRPRRKSKERTLKLALEVGAFRVVARGNDLAAGDDGAGVLVVELGELGLVEEERGHTVETAHF